MTEHLVILHSVSKAYATKRFAMVRDKKAASGVRLLNHSYGRETFFRIEAVSIGGFSALEAALNRLTRQPYAFVIRGAPLPDTNRNYTRRLIHERKNGVAPTFAGTARHWFAIDIDHVTAPPLTDVTTDPAGAIDHLIRLLPPDLHDASCWWQFTSSQGLPGHEETLSARLWYWNRTPLDDAALKRWAAAANRDGKIVDPALYSGVQPHYVAAPIFEEGMADPVPRRHGVRVGLEDDVELIIPPPDKKNPETVSGEGYEPGLGVDGYLDQLGPNASHRELIRSAIASFIAINGSKAEVAKLYDRIRAKLDEKEPGWRNDPRGQRYADNEHLDEITAWVRNIHGDQPPKHPEPPPEFDQVAPPPAEIDEPMLAPEFSDEQLALRFSAAHGAEARFVAMWGKWLFWDGSRWKADVTLSVLTRARTICRDASLESAPNTAAGIASAHRCRRCHSGARRSAPCRHRRAMGRRPVGTEHAGWHRQP